MRFVSNLFKAISIRHLSWTKRRQLCAVWGIVALVFQMSMPMSQSAMAMNMDMSLASSNDAVSNTAQVSSSADYGQYSLVICSAMGGTTQILNIQSVDNDQPPLGSKPSAPCVFCFSCCHGRSVSPDMMLVSELVLPHPMRPATVAVKPVTVMVRSTQVSLRHPPRAPPVFV